MYRTSKIGTYFSWALNTPCAQCIHLYITQLCKDVFELSTFWVIHSIMPLVFIYIKANISYWKKPYLKKPWDSLTEFCHITNHWYSYWYRPKILAGCLLWYIPLKNNSLLYSKSTAMTCKIISACWTYTTAMHLSFNIQPTIIETFIFHSLDSERNK